MEKFILVFFKLFKKKEKGDICMNVCMIFVKVLGGVMPTKRNRIFQVNERL